MTKPTGRDLGLGLYRFRYRDPAAGVNCAIGYHSRHRVDGSPYRYADSPIKLAESVDLLVVATTGDATTRNLVDRTVLQASGPGGYLINIARGSVVDQDALVELLAGGGLAGAGLDVFVDEPNVPAQLSASAYRERSRSYLNTGELLTPVP